MTSENDGVSVRGVTMLLGQLGNIVVRGLKERLQPYGLHPRHYAILQELERTPGVSQQAVSDLLLVHRSAMVALLDELEKRALVTRSRNPVNRREHVLHLTEEGSSLLHELVPVTRAFEAEFLEGLTKAEQRSLVSILRELAGRHEFTVAPLDG